MRCGIVGMGTRSVEADQGITPTIAHVPTGIVHGQPPTKGRFEKVPIGVTATAPFWLPCRRMRPSCFSASAGFPRGVEVPRDHQPLMDLGADAYVAMLPRETAESWVNSDVGGFLFGDHRQQPDRSGRRSCSPDPSRREGPTAPVGKDSGKGVGREALVNLLDQGSHQGSPPLKWLRIDKLWLRVGLVNLRPSPDAFRLAQARRWRAPAEGSLGSSRVSPARTSGASHHCCGS